MAKAEAESQRLQRETLTPEIIRLRAIEKWDGHFPTVMSGSGGGLLLNVAGAFEQDK